ncbi:MAG: hypothetical protein K0B16_04510 [Burkholderiaceae bacterium]|nr:hypothetical protein [Burkholderiaceae bacterium]
MLKTSVVSAVSAAVVVAVSFWLNPSPEQHREEIKKVVAERSPVAGMFGLGALTAFTSNYHPLGVASYATVNGRVVSIGFMGMVFVMQPEPESLQR